MPASEPASDATPQAPTARRIACPRCTAPMRSLALSSHKGQPLVVDHCPACRLVWFDAFESVHLDGFGWVRLLREMEHGAKQPMPPEQVARPACPQCAAPLNKVQNQSRFGLFAALECPRRHGHLHSHSGVLAERGLVRPLGVAERRALAEERHALHCLNCGGPAAAGDDDCSYCGTALVVFDLPRLAHSLRLRIDGMGASPQALGRQASWPCRGCGAALDPGRDTHCNQCGHMVVAHELPDIHALLDAADAELSAAATAEAARLARYAAMPRRRALQREVEAEAPGAPARSWMLGGWLPMFVLWFASLGVLIWGFDEPPRPSPRQASYDRMRPNLPRPNEAKHINLRTGEPVAEPVAEPLARRWSRMSAERSRAVVIALGILGFGLYCALAAGFGQRRAGQISLVTLAVLGFLAGRGEGAASVLLVGMYWALSVVLVFAFTFGFRLYRGLFRRFG